MTSSDARRLAELAAIVESSDDAIIGKTLDGWITSWNAAAEQIYGYNAAEAVGNHISMLLAPGQRDELTELLAHVARGDRVSHLETTRQRKDGRIIDVSITTSPIRDAQGAIVGAATVARDVTERKAHERELERLAQAAEYGTDAILSIGLDGRVRHWNQGAEKLYGYSASETIGRELRELTLLGDVTRDIDRVRRGEPAYQYEDQRRRKDGTIIDILTTVVPWRVGGQLIGLTGVTIDITERKRAEQAAARLAAIVESSDDAIITYSPEGVIETWNGGAQRLCGYTAEEVIGKPRTVLAAKGWNAQPFENVLAGATARYESRARRRDGSLFDTGVTMSPIRSADAEIVAVSCIWQDITERKQTERRLRENQAALEAALSSMTDAVFISDAAGRFVHFNEAFTSFHRFKSREQTLRSLADYPAILEVFTADGALAPFHQWAVPRALRGEVGVGVEYGLRRKDTGERWIGSYNFAPIRAIDGTIIGSVVAGRDITAQKEVEAERERATLELERLAQVARRRSDAIVSIDLEGRIRRWSEGAERVYGFSAEEALGKLVRELTLFSDEPTENIARVLAGECGFQYESRRRRKDGQVIDAMTTVLPWLADGQLVGITGVTVDVTERKNAERVREQTLAELEETQRLARLGAWTWDPKAGSATWSPHTYELFGREPAAGPAVGDAFLRCVHPEDRERIKGLRVDPYETDEFAFDFRILAGQDHAERVLYAIGHADPERPGCYRGTFQDVTEQRRAEAAEAASEAKSAFLSRMSHELRTPLNAISGFGQLLAMDDLEPEQAEHVGFVLEAARHMLALVDEVLDFSRIEAGKLRVSAEPVGLTLAVRDAIVLVATLADDNDVAVRMDTSGLAGDELVHADIRRLKQVLLNVLANAIKYNHRGGRVDVSFERLGDPLARVRILVSDTGIGIAPDDLNRLFEPFERLGMESGAIDGTGLGLALSRGLLQSMGATITASSTVGIGSTFAIELAVVRAPVAADESDVARQQSRADELSDREREPRRILHIEDNVSNVKLAERILERLDAIELIGAMEGSIGLGLAREHHPDLIILDLNLPDMPGEDVLRRLKAEPSTRDIPVVVLTEELSSGVHERVMRYGANELLSKPLDVPRFLKIVGPYMKRPPGP